MPRVLYLRLRKRLTGPLLDKLPHRRKDGVSVLTAFDLNDTAGSPRARHYLPLFEATAAPDPDTGDWKTWEMLLASREMAPGQSDANAAIHVETDWGFGTVSSSLNALPGDAAGEDAKPHWRFATAWPAREAYRVVLP